MTLPRKQKWPEQDLELVTACPFCGSAERNIAFHSVEDTAFQCAPGKWTYWDCNECGALYLNPRPTISSIGDAYKKYYTHDIAGKSSCLSNLKALLRNECLSYRLRCQVLPSLHFPALFNPLISLISTKIKIPFGWDMLASLPKGRLIDVGCGDGRTVAVAQRIGWNATGIEIDPEACTRARSSGLDIVNGDYALLDDFSNQLDCIMCSHVLEHVHDPLDLLKKLQAALKPGGYLLLTLPNSLSKLRYHFGDNWRGLEAPRHLAIPSERYLVQWLTNAGFEVQSGNDNALDSAAESFRIVRRAMSVSREDLRRARALPKHGVLKQGGNDFIKLVCRLKPDPIAHVEK